MWGAVGVRKPKTLGNDMILAYLAGDSMAGKLWGPCVQRLRCITLEARSPRHWHIPPLQWPLQHSAFDMQPKSAARQQVPMQYTGASSPNRLGLQQSTSLAQPPASGVQGTHAVPAHWLLAK
jgi:hypothetical protein